MGDINSQKFSNIDDNDLTKGIILSYTDGDICLDTPVGTPRLEESK
jgi:hypothetical protein